MGICSSKKKNDKRKSCGTAVDPVKGVDGTTEDFHAPNVTHDTENNQKPRDERSNEKAATKIQAGVRGYLGRKKVNKIRSSQVDMKSDKTACSGKGTEAEQSKYKESHENAATKIQAGVRGSRVRKELNAKKGGKENKEDEDDGESKRIDENYGRGNQENVGYDDEHDEGCANHENDVNNDDVRETKAATRIQAGIRGMQTRQQVKMKKIELKNIPGEISFVEGHDDAEDGTYRINDVDVGRIQAVNKIQAGYRGMKTRQDVEKYDIFGEEEKNIPYGTKDVSRVGNSEDLLNKSASKIQAGVRGMKIRKEMTVVKDETSPRTTFDKSYSMDQMQSVKAQEELDQATRRIQAGMKGMQVRKNMKKQNSEIKNFYEPTSATDDEEQKISRDTDKMNGAAVKIQAGMRGMQVRRQFKRRNSDGLKEETNDDADVAATKIQAGMRGMKVRRDLLKKRHMTVDYLPENTSAEAVAINSGPDKETVAATKIQAGVKAMQVRKDLKLKNSAAETLNQNDEIVIEDEPDRKLQEDKSGRKLHEDAAVKIQAGIRGMKTRNEIRNKKPDLSTTTSKDQSNNKNYGQHSVDLERGISKIQAGLKGMKTRKELNQTQISTASWMTFDASVTESQDS